MKNALGAQMCLCRQGNPALSAAPGTSSGETEIAKAGSPIGGCRDLLDTERQMVRHAGIANGTSLTLAQEASDLLT